MAKVGDDGFAEAEPDRPRGHVRRSRRARLRAISLIGAHVAIDVHILHWKLFKTTLTPLEPSEIIQTFGQGLVNAGAILFVLATFATLIFGRFFCGWGCHVLALQDLCSWLLAKVGIRPRPFRSRLLVFAPLLAAIFMFVLPTLTRLWMGSELPTLRAHLATDDLWARFPSWPVALFTLAVCGFGIVYALGNKAFCTYACPYGGIFGLVEPLAPVRIRVTDACDGCGHCTATCTSNVRVHEEVRVHEMVVDPGCMRCTDCVSVCPKDALHLGFGRPAAFRPAPRAEPRPRPPSYSWGEEIALATLFLLSVAILHKLYDAVPFLLSLALAAISAHLLVTVWRLVRSRSSLHYGRFELRRSGSVTRPGRWLAGVALVWVVFLGHSAWIQLLTLSGAAELNAVLHRVEPEASSQGDVEATDAAAADEATIRRSVGKLTRAADHGLVAPGNVLGLIAAGHAKLGEHRRAESYFQRAVQRSPDYAYAHLALARYAETRGDPEAQLRSLRAALAAEPELPDAHEALVRALSARGEQALALDALEELLAQRPQAVEIRLTYAMLLANLGRKPEAASETQRVIDAHPDHVLAHFNQVLILANQGRLDEARATCAPLLELAGDSPQTVELCRRVDRALAHPSAAAPEEPTR
jgi:tetratricopeptide (TPR) repeat protein/ferredoxin